MFRSLSLLCFNCRVNEKGAPSSGGNLRYNLREQYNWSYWITQHQQQYLQKQSSAKVEENKLALKLNFT